MSAKRRRVAKVLCYATLSARWERSEGARGLNNWATDADDASLQKFAIVRRRVQCAKCKTNSLFDITHTHTHAEGDTHTQTARNVSIEIIKCVQE